MRKSKTRQFNEAVGTFNLGVFNDYVVNVIVSSDPGASAAKRGIDVEQDWYAMHAGVVGQLVSYMFFPPTPPAEVIAHEAFHCVWHVMETIGAEHENEVMAYTLTYLVRGVNQVLKKARGANMPNRHTRKKEKTPLHLANVVATIKSVNNTQSEDRGGWAKRGRR